MLKPSGIHRLSGPLLFLDEPMRPLETDDQRIEVWFRRDGFERSHLLDEVNEIDLLARGDILLLYSDGLSEHRGGAYFPDEVQGLLSAHKDLTAEGICGRLRESLLEGPPREDDVTVVVVKYLP